LEASFLSEYLLARLDRQQPVALSRQIYTLIRELILTGQLPAHRKLPATRTLAHELGLSRNTLLAAYDQLVAEGYLASAFGSGTYVSDTAPPARSAAAIASDDVATAPLLSPRGAQLVREAAAHDLQWGAFVPGVPDVTLFPHLIWARLQSRRWRHRRPELLSYAHGGGYLPLRQTLAEHLRIARLVRCEPEQVLITTGIHQSLSVLARLLADHGDAAWMEDPGYWGARATLAACGMTPVAIPVDQEGLAPTPAQLREPPRLIVVTPSHQYPLGMAMSLARRRWLLEYAEQHKAWIVEDDYDSEFRFSSSPVASLQGLDQHERVLYLGTFSKTLYPGIRLGYMVVPKALSDPTGIVLSELYREGRLMDQAVLADFIEAGHYAAHIRRMKHSYAARQHLLHEAITTRFGADWPVSTHYCGLHLIMHLPRGVDDVAISIAARAQGLIARPLSRYYARAPQSPQQALPGLLLGYACVAEDQIAPAFDRLARLITPAL